jgi:hypothetical protein
MARQASSKPASGSSSATIGFEADSCPFSIRHSELVISSAWVQHFIHHHAPQGMAGFVLANGSMSSNQSGEGDILD